MAAPVEDTPNVDLKAQSKITTAKLCRFSWDFKRMKTNLWILYSMSANSVVLDAIQFYTVPFNVAKSKLNGHISS